MDINELKATIKQKILAEISPFSIIKSYKEMGGKQKDAYNALMEVRKEILKEIEEGLPEKFEGYILDEMDLVWNNYIWETTLKLEDFM